MRRDPSQVLAVGVSGPLEPYVAGFASHLAGRGYAPLSAANQLRVLAHLSRWLGERGLPVEGFTPERWHDMVNQPVRPVQWLAELALAEPSWSSRDPLTGGAAIVAMKPVMLATTGRHGGP